MNVESAKQLLLETLGRDVAVDWVCPSEKRCGSAPGVATYYTMAGYEGERPRARVCFLVTEFNGRIHSIHESFLIFDSAIGPDCDKRWMANEMNKVVPGAISLLRQLLEGRELELIKCKNYSGQEPTWDAAMKTVKDLQALLK